VIKSGSKKGLDWSIEEKERPKLKLRVSHTGGSAQIDKQMTVCTKRAFIEREPKRNCRRRIDHTRSGKHQNKEEHRRGKKS